MLGPVKDKDIEICPWCAPMLQHPGEWQEGTMVWVLKLDDMDPNIISDELYNFVQLA
jgi:hypothetical protein